MTEWIYWRVNIVLEKLSQNAERKENRSMEDMESRSRSANISLISGVTGQSGNVEGRHGSVLCYFSNSGSLSLLHCWPGYLPLWRMKMTTNWFSSHPCSWSMDIWLSLEHWDLTRVFLGDFLAERYFSTTPRDAQGKTAFLCLDAVVWE